MKKKKSTPTKVKKKINSRSKGKRGELELAYFFKEYGIEARRGQQYCGGGDSPDVIAGDCLSNIHIEVKRTQSGNLYRWMQQACRDADLCKTPVVAHRRNGQRWMAIMDMRDFVTIMLELHTKNKTKAFSDIIGEKMSENLQNYIEQNNKGGV